MYSTIDDIKKQRIPEETLIQLTDDDRLGVVDETVVDAAIAEAEELIDGFIRERYALPIASVPKLLTSLSADLATYILYGRRPEFEAPERVKDGYKNALALLGKIQEGKVSLGAAGKAEVGEKSAGASFSGADRRFTRDTLKGGM